MTDDELDDLLGPGNNEISLEAAAIARDLARTTFGRQPKLTRRRAVVISAVAILGLAAAGPLDQFLLSIPPFQSLEDGLHRAATGVPYSYVAPDGRVADCLAFVETRGTSERTRAELEGWLAGTDWSSYGHELALTLASPHPPEASQISTIDDAVLDDLPQRAANALGISYQGPEPTVTGGATNCTYREEER